ncbi:hypothetical protein HH195_01190 [Sarcina sp. JB2]|uniref:Uncharacterized protein n=1 Tax=Candidatus Sarcina troglodytae TaxID=2726954 RepID=A0ACD1BAW0_9CLOT|nr:hypothetical protein [Sarcina sp. JB2]QPJ84604.1 hypothetical protein HH195_01190 [Sarcina sp. JB2]
MRSNKVDFYIKKYIQKYKYELFIIIISILAIFIRCMFFNVVSGDYKYFLEGWFNTLKANGGIFAIKDHIGNYTAPYMLILGILTYIPINSLYTIKIVSIIFDFIGAFVGARIVYKFCKNEKYKKLLSLCTYATILFSPTVILNSSAWGQCDMIYATFVLASLLFLFDKKYTKTFIFLGIAFSFKLQTIFILPLYIILYLKGEDMSILNFFIIPITVLVVNIPALLLGRPIETLITQYMTQVGQYKELTMNLTNIYTFVPNYYKVFSTAGIIFTIFIFAMLTMFILSYKFAINNKIILQISILSILICNYFLPSMHERYIYIAGILGIIYFFIDRRKWYIPLGIISISFFCYINYLFDYLMFPKVIMAIVFLLIIIKLAIDLVKNIITEGSKEIC